MLLSPRMRQSAKMRQSALPFMLVASLRLTICYSMPPALRMMLSMCDDDAQRVHGYTPGHAHVQPVADVLTMILDVFLASKCRAMLCAA